MNLDGFEACSLSSYLAELATNDDLRQRISGMRADIVDREMKIFLPEVALEISGESQKAADTLRSEGVVSLGQLLNKAQVDDVLNYLSNKDVYPSHVASISKAAPSTVDALRGDSPFASYRLQDVAAAPHLLEVANSKLVLGIAASYLGCVPTLYSMNAWWSFAKEGDGLDIGQRLHRDPDDMLFCSMFIYLTDVGSDNGPHFFIKETHNDSRMKELLAERGGEQGMSADEVGALIKSTYYRDGNAANLEKSVVPLLHDKTVTLLGSAGDAFMEDTYGLHRGVPSKSGDRLVVWLRYGISKTLSFEFDHTRPVKIPLAERLGPDALYRYVNRLLVE